MVVSPLFETRLSLQLASARVQVGGQMSSRSPILERPWRAVLSKLQVGMPMLLSS